MIPIRLVSIGDLRDGLLPHLNEELADGLGTYSYRIINGPRIDVPEEAYDRNRSQYKSDVLLDELRRMGGGEDGKVIGLTEKDLYNGNLNFVFGQAQSPGTAAVVSLFRLRPRRDQYAITEQFLERTTKEVLHELGHTLGLKHCGHSDCVMQFSNSLAEVDQKSKQLCASCKETLEG